MKFINVVISALALSPSVQAALRSKQGVEATKSSKAQIVIQGVLHDFSGKDLAIINESAVKAFNSVQKETRFSLEEVNPVMYFGAGEGKNLEQCHYCPPDDDTFVNQCHYCPPDDDALTTKKTGFEQILFADIKVSSKQCHYCPPDDDALELANGANHKAFVQSFCNLLATSGSANLANANHCSFSFLGATGHKVAPLSVVKRSAAKNEGEAALGFLSITGLIHNLSDKDMAIVEKEALATYNDAFASTSSSFKSLKVRSGVVTPKVSSKQCHYCPPDDDAVADLTQCHYCPPDDDAVAGLTQCHYCPPDDDTFASKTLGNVLFLDIETLGETVSQCHYCPPDDDTMSVENMQTMAMAFSKALCSKLRSSGMPNLAYADDCALDFFFEHEVGSSQEEA